MTARERFVRIQLCGVHEFSHAEMRDSKSTNFVQCRKGCTLEWGETHTWDSKKFGFKLEVKVVK